MCHRLQVAMVTEAKSTNRMCFRGLCLSRVRPASADSPSTCGTGVTKESGDAGCFGSLLVSSFLKLVSSSLRLASSFLRLASSFLKLVSFSLELASSFLRLASSFLREDPHWPQKRCREAPGCGTAGLINVS